MPRSPLLRKVHLERSAPFLKLISCLFVCCLPDGHRTAHGLRCACRLAEQRRWRVGACPSKNARSRAFCATGWGSASGGGGAPSWMAIRGGLCPTSRRVVRPRFRDTPAADSGEIAGHGEGNVPHLSTVVASAERESLFRLPAFDAPLARNNAVSDRQFSPDGLSLLKRRLDVGRR